MSELSRAAQAIWDAWDKAPLSPDFDQMDRDALAAALSAAALYCKRDRLLLLSIAEEIKTGSV